VSGEMTLRCQRGMRWERRASRIRPRSNRLDSSSSVRSDSVRPARGGSSRHQHSKPQSRSSPTRRRGMPVPGRRSSPVSKSKKPSKLAACPVRSGSPSRQSRRITQGVPGRISSAARTGRPRAPRLVGRCSARASRAGTTRASRADTRPRRGSRSAGARSGWAGACCGRAGRRRPPRDLRRGDLGSSGMRQVWHVAL
jgi:hypothetical protein